jgi:pentatricopeptide repeat protein
MTILNPVTALCQRTTIVLFVGLTFDLHPRKATNTAFKAHANAKNNSLRLPRKDGQLMEAMHALRLVDNQVDSFAYVSLLQLCVKRIALPEGKLIHAHIKARGVMATNIFVHNALVNLYSKCGSLADARRVFDEMPERDAFSWSVMISAHNRHGLAEEALALFRHMQMAGIQVDHFIFSSVLQACAKLVALEQGMEIHDEILRSGFEFDVFVQSALVDMYAKCGSIEDARQLFDKMSKRDVVSWTAMIAGYAQNGQVDEALALFQQMPERNMVSWTAMIAGYAQNGRCAEALELFKQMQLAGIRPEPKTFASVLPVCANLAALDQGMQIHELINRSGFQSDVSVVNALMDMYAKCGKIDKVRKLFGKMHQRNVVSWTTMIAGYAMHGFGKQALEIFEQMRCNGTSPNHITFVGVLSACCHAGLVDEGCRYFNCMSECYNIAPAMEHYSIVVDLLGRAGCLDEARDFINKMPIKPSATVLGSLLGACKIYHNIELGEQVAELFFELNPQNAAPYLLLSNIYAAAGRWGDVEKVQKMMKNRGVKKMSGCSWIEVNRQVHAFRVGEIPHIQA